jgi:hypothetical protein
MTSTQLKTTSPEELIKEIDRCNRAIKAYQAIVDECKASLQSQYDAGLIPDKLTTPYGSATLTTRSTWTYSDAIKQAQEMEILEGVATKKTSSSWTIRPATPEQLDF